MTYKRVIVSDFSEEVFTDEKEVGTVTILNHPTHGARMPVRLHATPEEWAKHTFTPCIVVEYTHPSGEVERGTMLVEDFNALAANDVDLDEVIAEQALLQRPPEQPKPRRERGKGRPPGYHWTAEHAGEPHSGKVNPHEIAMIHRLGLDAVNARLRDTGFREINPADPAMRSRYRLDALEQADGNPPDNQPELRLEETQ